MHQDQAVIKISTAEAVIISLLLLGGISFTIIGAGAVPHVPIIGAVIALLVYGLLKKVRMKDLEEGMAEGARSGLGAVFIFFFIGMLISSWMASGTIPTFIHLALTAVSGKYFFAIAFAVTAVIGISIGSSLTTAATLGAAFVSAAAALDLSTAAAAGAVISGAFFGDKMSPLSDTTNLASMTVKVDLFDHIKNMAWTTIPAFVISIILFAIISPAAAETDFKKIAAIKNSLEELNLVSWQSLIPFAVLAVLAVRKVPAILTLSASTVSALILAPFIQSSFGFNDMVNILYSGYKSNTGMEELDSLLTRGGIESMLFSVSLVLLALSMGGLLFKLGILPALLDGIKGLIVKAPALISATAASAIGINFLLGEQYLSILLTGNAFAESYKKAGLHLKNLSRVLEDAGTVINPLVPWSVCGVFLTGVLNVPTAEYIPFTFFCLLSPIITLLFGWTGITITKASGK